MRARMFPSAALVLLMSGHFTNDLFVGVLPVLYPHFKAAFDLDNARIGLITLAYSATSSLAQPLFGWISDRFPRGWIPPIIVLWGGIFVGLYGFADSFLLLVIFAMGSALGSAAWHPIGASSAAKVVAEKVRNRTMSIYTVAGTAGYALGPMIAVILVGVFGMHGTVTFAALGLVVAVTMAARFRLLDTSRYATATHRAANAAVAASADYGMLARVIGVVMLRSWVYSSIIQFTPVWYDDLGYGKSFYGALVTILSLASAVGTLAGGWFADRVGGRTVVIWSMASSVPALLLYAQFPGANGFLFGSAFGLLSDCSLVISLLAAQRLMPGRTGIASSVILGLGFITGGIGVPVTGYIIDHTSYAMGFRSLAIFGVAATVLAATIPSRIWGEAEPRTDAAGSSPAAA
jgi:FSR family fosmidomycin resistance protein-like MFS transporter